MVEKISDILLAIDEAAHPDEVGLFTRLATASAEGGTEGVLERDRKRKLASHLSV